MELKAEKGKYRKKPVVVDAAQWLCKGHCPVWAQHAVREWHTFFQVTTPEGVMRGEPGDWIIRGAKGEISLCKADIFAATYEPADAEQPAAQAAGLTDEEILDIASDHFRYAYTGELAVSFARALLSRAAPSEQQAEQPAMFGGGAQCSEVSSEHKAEQPHTKQLADWLLTDPQTGEPLHFAGPLERDFLGLSRVRMESKSGAVWTLTAGLREGYLTASERMQNIRDAAKAEGEQPAETMIHYGGGLAGNVSFEQPAEEARGVDLPSDEQIAETSQQICRLLLGDVRKVDTDIIDSHIRALLAAPAEEAGGVLAAVLGPDEDGIPIARYSHRSHGMLEHPNGTWVRYADVAGRARRAAALLAAPATQTEKSNG